MNGVTTLIRQPWLWAWLGALAVWLATAAFTGGKGSGEVLSAAMTFGAFFVIVALGLANVTDVSENKSREAI